MLRCAILRDLSAWSLWWQRRQVHAGQRNVHELDTDLTRDIKDALVAIELAEDDARHAGVDELLEAVPARARGDVVGRAFDHDAVTRGLDDRVRLCVDRRDAVTVLHHVANVRAVRHAADRAVVASRQDRTIADQHRAYVLARTGRARRDHLRDAHEVLVPGRSRSDVLWHDSLYGPRLSVQVQGDSQPSGDRLPHARRSREARAGDPDRVGGEESLRTDSGCPRGCTAVGSP